MLDSSAQANPIPEGKIRRWIMRHDDSWWFIVPYIGLAVILSIAISLFWLVAVVAAHFALEWMRQIYITQQMNPRPNLLGVAGRVAWELKLDIALILFALVLALYMDLVLGVVGLGAAGRAGVMTGARFTVLQRVLRGIFMSLDDMAQVVRVVLGRKKSNGNGADEAQAEEEEEDLRSGWHKPWGRGDKFVLGFGALCLILIVIAPLLTDHSFGSMFVTLAEELHPFPMNGDDG